MAEIIELAQRREAKAKAEAKAERSHVKDMAHWLIDKYDGDFAIVLHSENLKDIADGLNGAKFIAAVSDVKKIDRGEDYFFADFYRSNMQFLDLNT